MLRSVTPRRMSAIPGASRESSRIATLPRYFSACGDQKASHGWSILLGSKSRMSLRHAMPVVYVVYGTL